MAKVLKRNNTKKNRNTNKKINKSRKNTKGGLRLTKPNMDCGSPFSPQWNVQEGGDRWREHVRKVMKQHPQEKFGKVLAIAKKTYKKKGGAKKNKNTIKMKGGRRKTRRKTSKVNKKSNKLIKNNKIKKSSKQNGGGGGEFAEDIPNCVAKYPKTGTASVQDNALASMNWHAQKENECCVYQPIIGTSRCESGLTCSRMNKKCDDRNFKEVGTSHPWGVCRRSESVSKCGK